jgi:hypothetical protein
MASHNKNILEENSDNDIDNEQNKKKNLRKLNLNDLYTKKNNVIKENNNLENK